MASQSQPVAAIDEHDNQHILKGLSLSTSVIARNKTFGRDAFLRRENNPGELLPWASATQLHLGALNMLTTSKTISIVVIAVGFAAIGACATAPQGQVTPTAQEAAQEPAEVTKSTAAAEKPAGDEIVCKRVESTGSNFKRRLCQSVDEWDAQRKEGREALDRLNRKNREGCTLSQNC